MQKHILIINRYFYPDLSSVPQLLRELAEDLVGSKGFKISVVCSRNSYNSTRKYKKRENLLGINIYRTSNVYGKGRGIIYRLLEMVTFFLFAFYQSLKVKKVDLVVALSSPPLIPFLGMIVGKSKRAKLLFLIEDVYPDLAVALGYLSNNGLLHKIITRSNYFFLKRADQIVVIGHYMKQVILKNYPKIGDKLDIISNWADGSKIYPLKKNDNPFIDKFNLRDKFVIQYSGNMGLGHTFDTILKGALKLQPYQDIIFLFIGEGAKKREILQFRDTHSLNNIHIYTYQAYEDLLYSLNACDVALVSLVSEVNGLSVPSKIYGILASGKPFIMVGSGYNEISDLSRSNRIGRVVQDGDGDGFVSSVLLYYNNREMLEKEGKLARKIFEKRFDKSIAVAEYYRLIKMILK